MLANKWQETKKRVFPYFVQPKYNGVRCIWRPDVGEMFTRKNEVIPLLPHIRHALRDYPMLDGELLADGLPFQTIEGIVMRTANKSNLADQVYFMAFDLPSKSPQSIRLAELAELPSSDIIRISPYDVAVDEEDVMAYHQKCVENGFEGVMLRDMEAPYEFNRRVSTLLKLKVFDTDDFLIVDVSQDKDGMPILWFRSETGVPFKLAIKGSLEYKRSLVPILPTLVGKYATVKYICLTEDKVPFHANVVSIKMKED